MLENLGRLFACQLAGEALQAASGLPLSGPILGMALMFVWLLWRGMPDGLEATSRGLLQHLSLLFVPAGTGVIAYGALIGAEWLAISLAVVGSAVATIAVTAWIMTRLERAAAEHRPAGYAAAEHRR
jgi:holin-like protein